MQGGKVMGKATQDLRKEHDAILYVLQILDKMMTSKSSKEESLLRYYGEVIYFLKAFVDKCHHGKEENYLFKELVSRGILNEGGPVGAMLQEHAQGRDYVAQMSRCLDEKDISGFNAIAVQYRDLLRRHIQTETSVLFQLADTMIDDKAQDLLFEEFEQYEENVIGHGVHEKLHAMIDSWAKAFGVE
jgi:hemerythrin-like domain-containing protein